MARFDVKFLDKFEDTVHIKVNAEFGKFIRIIIKDDDLPDYCAGLDLDKSTAIKFAKALRTEINKVVDEEVNNG